MGAGLRHLADPSSPHGNQWAAAICRVGKIPSKVLGACSSSEPPLSSAAEAFDALARVIIFQQLNGKACKTILARCLGALGLADSQTFTPSAVLAADMEFRADGDDGGKPKMFINGKPSGLSRRKAEYLTALAEHFSDPDKLEGVELSALGEDELKARLIAVKGLGAWSVEMFMIFRLGRQDVFSPGDLALRKSAAKLLGRKETEFKSSSPANMKAVAALAEPWAPYRSLASMYLYALADTETW